MRFHERGVKMRYEKCVMHQQKNLVNQSRFQFQPS